MTGFFLANGSQEPNWHKGKSRRAAPAARVFTSGQTRAVYFGFDLGTPDAWPRLNLRFTAATYTSGIIPTLRIFVSRPVGGLNELSSAASHSRHRHAVCSHRRRGSSQISVIRIEGVARAGQGSTGICRDRNAECYATCPGFYLEGAHEACVQ
jgi:hypothetical protein